jgi:hypothetical protein
MAIDTQKIGKFAAVFAEAVLTYLDSGEAQWLLWDGVSNRFDFMSVDLDEPPALALLGIDEGWQKLTGDVNEITDPEHEHFDIDALRNAIEHQLIEEGYGERILKGILKRIQQVAELAADEADDNARDQRNSDED